MNIKNDQVPHHVSVSERRLLCLCSQDGVDRLDVCFFKELYVVSFLYSVLETKCSNLSSSSSSSFTFDFTFCIQQNIINIKFSTLKLVYKKTILYATHTTQHYTSNVKKISTIFDRQLNTKEFKILN